MEIKNPLLSSNFPHMLHIQDSSFKVSEAANEREYNLGNRYIIRVLKSTVKEV